MGLISRARNYKQSTTSFQWAVGLARSVFQIDYSAFNERIRKLQYTAIISAMPRSSTPPAAVTPDTLPFG